ncbi:MAG: hypothetical protein PHV60_02220 [bacterium]|nr:hypothetical protein [bacterium]
MIGFIFSFVVNYFVAALGCFITTWIVMKILKNEYPSLVAFQVALVAPFGAISIIPYLGWILVPLIAFFIMKKYLNYEFKGMIVVMVIWIVIFIPLYWALNWGAYRLMIKLLFPPEMYESMQQYIREHRR